MSIARQNKKWPWRAVTRSPGETLREMFPQNGSVDILAAHDADELSVFHNRDAVHVVCKHDAAGFEDRCVGSERQDTLRHIARDRVLSHVVHVRLSRFLVL